MVELLSERKRRRPIQSNPSLRQRSTETVVDPARWAASSTASEGLAVRFFEMGLYRLRGRVRYPAQAAPQKPSLSRVQEICEHGLKGDIGNGSARTPRQ